MHTGRRLIFSAFALCCTAALAGPTVTRPSAKPSSALSLTEQAALGSLLFRSATVSRDGKTSCQTCHNPQHAYADTRPRSIGAGGKIGTRNAPSLIGIGDDDAFFWEGRRSRLEEVVLDPFTNPVELGLLSTTELIDKLSRQGGMKARFKLAFPEANHVPTTEQIGIALAAFVRSLHSNNSAYDHFRTEGKPLSAEAEYGRRLFEGIAGCSSCHSTSENPARLSDGQYHHSGIGQSTQSPLLPSLTRAVIEENLDEQALGHRVLTDLDWSSLGRFIVSHRPTDIGAFRTPSLRNVAVTSPYMHDGSIVTLAQAVDHEIYYRGLSRGRPINLSQAERQAIVAFLETLTDSPWATETTSH